METADLCQVAWSSPLGWTLKRGHWSWPQKDYQAPLKGELYVEGSRRNLGPLLDQETAVKPSRWTSVLWCSKGLWCNKEGNDTLGYQGGRVKGTLEKREIWWEVRFAQEEAEVTQETSRWMKILQRWQWVHLRAEEPLRTGQPVSGITQDRNKIKYNGMEDTWEERWKSGRCVSQWTSRFSVQWECRESYIINGPSTT